jgi:hypothetical protein
VPRRPQAVAGPWLTIGERRRQALGGQPAGQRSFDGWRSSSRSASITSTTSDNVGAARDRWSSYWSANGLAALRQPVEVWTAFQSCEPLVILISDSIVQGRYDKRLTVIVNP